MEVMAGAPSSSSALPEELGHELRVAVLLPCTQLCSGLLEKQNSSHQHDQHGATSPSRKGPARILPGCSSLLKLWAHPKAEPGLAQWSSWEFQMDGATGLQIQGFSSSRQVLQKDRKRLQVSGRGCQKGTEVAGNPKQQKIQLVLGQMQRRKCRGGGKPFPGEQPRRSGLSEAPGHPQHFDAEAQNPGDVRSGVPRG